jgi:hypothetical protein
VIVIVLRRRERVKVQKANVSHGKKTMFTREGKSYLPFAANKLLAYRVFTSEAVSFRWKDKSKDNGVVKVKTKRRRRKVKGLGQKTVLV